MSLRSVHWPLLGALLALAPGASAAGNCADFREPLVVTGSTAIKPLIAEVARLLAPADATPDAGTQPAGSVLYAGSGSCAGVSAILEGSALTTSTLSYWDRAGSEQTCTLDPATTTLHADIGVSDVFASTCASLPNGLPGNVRDFQGPIQTMTLSVPHGSPEQAISREAAYYVFGFGAGSGVAPWTSESLIFRRSSDSGTQRMIAAAIGVDARRWKGAIADSSADMVEKLIGASAIDARAAIGILDVSSAHENAALISVLAYQDSALGCAVYPDSTANSRDKANVRAGRYPLWGPMHLLTTVNGSSYPTNPRAARLINYLTGAEQPPVELDLIALEAHHEVVPQCAMRVRRTQEMGPSESFAPSEPCGCYYESRSGGAPACKACTATADCGASNAVCSHGYCESAAQ
jgi:ABC-type phosphate transport system substrate-binding protein